MTLPKKTHKPVSNIQVQSQRSYNPMNCYHIFQKISCQRIILFLVEDLQTQQNFLHSIAYNIQPLRPSHRSHKPIDIQKPIYIAEDLFIDFQEKINQGGTSFNIEIKPKSPLPLLDSSDTTYSKFFKVQLQKLQNQLGKSISEVTINEIEQKISKYDPRQLFQIISEESVQHLFENPQNNLKVFFKGKEVKDLKNFIKNQPFNLFNIISKSFQEKEILKKILQVQMLPKKTIDETIEIYEKLLQNQVSCEDIEKALINLNNPESCSSEDIKSLVYLANFMQLITWSDISIIANYVVLPKEINDPILEGFDKLNFDDDVVYYRMRIIDYELKSFSKLYAYQKQGIEIQQIFQTYLKMKNDQKQLQ